MSTLALDVSSTNIGFVARRDDGALTIGTIPLKSKKLNTRIVMAHLAFRNLLDEHQPDEVTYEGPAYKSFEIVSQQRTVGVLCLVCEQRATPMVEIPPTEAKKALTGNGRASKEAMIAHARSMTGSITIDEHGADAYGVLRAHEMRKEKGRRAA